MSGNSLLHLEKTDRRPFPYPCGENLSRTEKRAGEERKANRPEPQRLCRTPARSRHDPASFMPARSCGVCRWQPGIVYKGGQFILKDWRKIRPYPVRPCDSFRRWKSFIDSKLFFSTASVLRVGIALHPSDLMAQCTMLGFVPHPNPPCSSRPPATTLFRPAAFAL